MTEKEQIDIFQNNLNRYMEERQLTQKEVADAIGVIPQTFNTWMKGKAIPRMDKVQKLSDYFGVKVSDLVDDHSYDLTAETLQEAFDRRPDMRVLFSVAKDCTPDEIEQAIKIIEVLKK